MADFLTLKKLEDKITDIICHAKETLLILSPYIKLDEYFKKLFSNHLKNPQVHIIIVFGKNEDNRGKSLRQEDFEFFKQFPTISILYLKDLHAKYYANEAEGIVTSINLHDYSFKNNIEFGIYSKNPEQRLLGLATIKNPFSDSLDSTAWEYATGFMNQAEAVFIKRPVIQKKMFGLSTTHMGSEVCYDNTEFFNRSYGSRQGAKKVFDDFPEFIEYGKAAYVEKPTREEVPQAVKPEVIPPINYGHPGSAKSYNSSNTSKHNKYNNNNQPSAFCIRTGDRIPFNTNYPFSNEAYQSWKQWRNEDYTENYCHACGRPSTTSKRRPLCDQCFYS